jgi:phosphoribosylglycinamide formyltransferase 1
MNEWLDLRAIWKKLVFRMKLLAVFASGSGTNAENIIRYFQNHDSVRVSMIFCNDPDAGVVNRVEGLDLDLVLFNREQFYKSFFVIDRLKQRNIDLVVLAGFLWLIPPAFIREYSGRIINIHPALLPSYGGKGMYGSNVHRAVLESGDSESGISIHYVNEEYDRGEIIFQSRCPVNPGDTPESLAARIHELEYLHYPRVIENLLFEKSVYGSGKKL